MESASGHHDDLLASIKTTFCRGYERQGFTELQIRELWLHHADSLVPRCQAMSRSRTASTKSRTSSTESINKLSSRKRANSLAIATPSKIADSILLQTGLEDQAPENAFIGRKMQRTASGSRMLIASPESTLFEDPTDYLQKFGTDSYQVPPPPSGAFSSFPGGIHIPSYESPTLTSSLSCSFNQSLPLTPDSTQMQNDAYFASPMGRQDSLGVDFRAGFEMFRLGSQASNASDYAVIHPTPFVPHLNETSSHNFLLAHPKESLQCSLQQNPPTMYESYAGSQIDPSSSSPNTKHQRGASGAQHHLAPRRKSSLESQHQSSERLIKPKPRHPSDSSNSRVSPPMVAGESESGVMEKCQISKATYTRPAKQKLKCEYCDKQPDGFRGDHELRRHQNLHHTNTRIGWICVDPSPNGKTLDDCKHCRGGKVYGAYYNAAAHLRRVHFHPRNGDRKVPGYVSRAGKGGGDHPPMEELKSRWMREVNVNAGESELPFEDQDQTAFHEPLIANYPSNDGYNNGSADATEFALLTSDYLWQSREHWTELQLSSHFEDTEIFGLELS